MHSVDAKLKAHYKHFQPPSKVDSLTEEMVRQIGKGTKLRANDAEAKGCMPFVVGVAVEMAAKRPSDDRHQTIAACTACLLEFNLLFTITSGWQMQRRMLAGCIACSIPH